MPKMYDTDWAQSVLCKYFSQSDLVARATEIVSWMYKLDADIVINWLRTRDNNTRWNMLKRGIRRVLVDIRGYVRKHEDGSLSLPTQEGFGKNYVVVSPSCLFRYDDLFRGNLRKAGVDNVPKDPIPALVAHWLDNRPCYMPDKLGLPIVSRRAIRTVKDEQLTLWGFDPLAIERGRNTPFYRRPYRFKPWIPENMPFRLKNRKK